VTVKRITSYTRDEKAELAPTKIPSKIVVYDGGERKRSPRESEKKTIKNRRVGGGRGVGGERGDRKGTSVTWGGWEKASEVNGRLPGKDRGESPITKVEGAGSVDGAAVEVGYVEKRKKAGAGVELGEKLVSKKRI